MLQGEQQVRHRAAHQVHVEPVSGYLGGSAISVWEHLEPLVAEERARRAQNAPPDPD
ncbi:hypothetical protein ACWEC4_40010 [Streptomyces sp. NPDC005055]